jgi:hypothetical protein
MHQYLFRPTHDLWPGSSVDAIIKPVPAKNPDGSFVINFKTKKPVPILASKWLDQNKRVQQITWAPGEPEIITGKIVQKEGGWIDHDGTSTYNLYRSPTLNTDDLANVTDADIAPWRGHIYRIYPTDADHIIKWFAHRLQKPQEKINHALLLGGEQGIGKDTMIEPVKRAIGAWNFKEASPNEVLGTFNGFLKAVILRISEVRDLGGNSRYALYEKLKTMTAAPPDTLTVNEKHLRPHPINNIVGVIMTTNYKINGIYLPRGDRRTYVAWSNCIKEEFPEKYYQDIWHWYIHEDGMRKVAAYLLNYDLSGFDPKAPPPQTDAWWTIVGSGAAPEETELEDLLDRMGTEYHDGTIIRKDAVTIEMMAQEACKTENNDLAELSNWLVDRDNRSAIPHRMEECGYTVCRNTESKSTKGLWRIDNKLQRIYALASLTGTEQIKAARELKKTIEAELRKERAAAEAAENAKKRR